MENWEQQTLINELSQGMDLAKQLRFHVGPSSTTETREYLVQKILSSYDKALMILNWSETCSNVQGKRPQLSGCGGASSLLPESPCSHDGSLQSEASDFKDSENGLEGPHDDGYSWRKYGQKDILGAKYPRSYYRCTYRNIKHCLATKQVQRSDEDPTAFEITYKGKHTCVPDCNPSALPLTSGLSGYTVNSNYSAANFDGSLMQIFSSPATSGSNYLPVSPIQQNNSFGGDFGTVCCSESDRGDIFSSNASTTNSPYLDLDFSLELANADPNFPFNASGFFP